jgi:hypothetical protein
MSEHALCEKRSGIHALAINARYLRSKVITSKCSVYGMELAHLVNVIR